MVAQLSEYIENHWIVPFKRVNCMVEELYLSKGVFKDPSLQHRLCDLKTWQNEYPDFSFKLLILLGFNA